MDVTPTLELEKGEWNEITKAKKRERKREKRGRDRVPGRRGIRREEEVREKRKKEEEDWY